MQRAGTVIVSIVRDGYTYTYYYDEHIFNTVHIKTKSRDMIYVANKIEKYCECGQCVETLKDRYEPTYREDECPVCDKRNVPSNVVP